VTARVRTAVLLLALSLTVATAADAQVFWPRENPPGPLPARDVQFPPYEVKTLANGLQVVAVLHHEQPAVSMRLLVRAGGASDPRNKLGLARLATNLLDQGTTSKTAQEIADAVDFIGGAESTGAGTDLSFINMIVMKDSFDVAMRMVSDFARNPSYNAGDIERMRRQMLSGLQVSTQDPEYIANAVFDRLVYGFHPYGLPQQGTPETIAGLTRDDLVAFHDRYFAPNNAILAIVGDVTADEAFSEAQKVFGDWQKKTVPAASYGNPPDPSRRLIIVNKPDAVQTEVRVGNIGVPRKHADYMALNLAVRILGGEGSNRLHQVLRTERGLTYGAQAAFDTLKFGGDIEAETNTRSEQTGEVLRLIVDEFWRIQRERVSDRELADAKAYLTGSFPLTIETPEQIALQVLNAVFYDLPLSDLQNFRERVNAVTVDDVQRVARQYLKPDRLSIALVGNAKAFASQLEGIGYGKIETVDLDALDLTAADFKREKAVAGGGRLQPVSYQLPSRPPVMPREGEQAKALLDKVVAAKGGLERLRAVKSVTATTTSTMRVQGQSMDSGSATTYLQYPDRVRVDMTVKRSATDTVSVQQGYDGQHAWGRAEGHVFPDDPTVLQSAKEGFKRDTLRLLLGGESGTIRVRLLPDVKDDGGKIFRALEFSAKDLNPIVLSIDPATGLIAKQTYVLVPGEPPMDEQFSDYRSVDGYQVPFTTIAVNGQASIERRITSIKFNAPIDPTIFKTPKH
jgi:zinc protease